MDDRIDEARRAVVAARTAGDPAAELAARRRLRELRAEGALGAALLRRRWAQTPGAGPEEVEPCPD